ncbi:MAG: hypothetical protein ACOVQX_01865 [Legionella sp.]
MTDETKWQTTYFTYLTEKAIETTNNNEDKLNFDPQGRILVTVTLNEDDYKTIAARMAVELSSPANKLTISEQTGLHISDTTTISLDTNAIGKLQENYFIRIKNELDKTVANNKQEADQIITLLKDAPKGSIIALQQEFSFHLALTARIYENHHAFAGTKEDMLAALEQTTKEVNALIIKEFALALKKAYNGKELSLEIINSELDKARKNIFPQAHALFVTTLIDKTGIILDVNEAQGLKNDKIAEKMTATDNAILHLNDNLGLATYIGGSSYTAHHRQEKDKFAHRQILTHNYVNGHIQTKDNPRTQIRTPSLDLKIDRIQGKAAIEDIRFKLNHIREHYHLDKKINHHPKAFIYNLHTALNGYADSENLQSKGAKEILQGAHAYNQSQLNEKPDAPIFCWIQNISVNGFGDHLGYRNIFQSMLRYATLYDNALTHEATLMSEMALMHTIYGSCAADIQDKIITLRHKYTDYLKSENRPDYFSQSREGQDCIEAIREIKQALRKDNSKPEENVDLSKLAVHALKKLSAYDYHCTHDYAKLVQTLSVFVEEASISGCKSGNERAQAINGRVAILDTLANNRSQLNDDGRHIIISLNKLAQANDDKTIDECVQKLNYSLDKAYNRHGLQSAASMISLVDQGAPSKLEAKGIIPNTNFAEAKQHIMSNLKQAGAKEMQAHKQLPTMMIKAWKKNQQPNRTPEQQKIVDGLITQIGNYGTLNDSIANKILKDDRIKNIFYHEVTKYQETHIGKDPNHHRIKFINYLFSKKIQNKLGLDLTKKNELIASNNPAAAAIDMETLLDRQGVQLYSAALKEERYSKEFMNATLHASTMHYQGAKWEKRLAIPIGGPSSSGKSYATKAILKKAKAFMPCNKTNMEGNYVVSIDGGIARETSQIRKLVIQHAMSKNYTGINDLQDISNSVLKNVKKNIEKTIMATTDISMVIPETFSKPAASKKLMQSLNELPNTEVMFARVDSKDKHFAATVKFNGDNRAFSAQEQWDGNYNLNLDKKYLPESKKYYAGPFNLFFNEGKSNSEDAEAKHQGIAFILDYELGLYQCIDGEWKQARDSAPGVKCFSKRIVRAWQQRDPNQDPRTLEEFSRAEQGQLDAIIKTPQQLSLEKTTTKLVRHLNKANINHIEINKIIKNIQKLNYWWDKEQWVKYQTEIGRLQQAIVGLLPTLTLPPFTNKIIDDLHTIYEVELVAIRRNVPDASKIKPVNLEPIKLAKNEFIIAKESISNFTHEIINANDAQLHIPEHKIADNSNCNAEFKNKQHPEFNGLMLKDNQAIRSTLRFDDDKCGILLQDARGKISDLSQGQLNGYEQTIVALEQAQRLLSNWRPGNNTLIINGDKPEATNKLYAALLMIKKADPDLNKIQIQSHARDCTGPTTIPTRSKQQLGNHEEQFIKKHLSAVTPDLLETYIDATIALKRSFNSNHYKHRLETMKLSDERELADDQKMKL